jgi:hypothetical protein
MLGFAVGVHMLPAQRSKRGSYRRAVMIAPVLTGALLLCLVVHALHDCHGEHRAACPVCMHAKAAICTPEAAPPAMPETRTPLVLPPEVRPSCPPLLTFAARGPPIGLL